jgi:hypothetical protein
MTLSWSSFYDVLNVHATWPKVSLLFFLFLLCMRGFNWRQEALGCENKVLDARFWYTPDEAQCLFRRLGVESRRLYAITELTLDLIFPVVYGVLFAFLLIHLYPRQHVQALLLIPLAAMMLDIVENVLIAYLALSFDGSGSPVTRVAAVFTSAKFVCFLLSLVLILAGSALGIYRI